MVASASCARKTGHIFGFRISLLPLGEGPGMRGAASATLTPSPQPSPKGRGSFVDFEMSEQQTINDAALCDHVLYVLRGEGAHISFEDFVADFPAELCGQRVEGLPYTAWQVLEHMRIAQWDILEFSRNPKHLSPKWPEGYWPPQDQLGTSELWQETVNQFRHDLRDIESLVADASTDLGAKIPHGTGQTILREALLVADHNSYHLGALVVMSRMLKRAEDQRSKQRI